jgi:hypothetical protein
MLPVFERENFEGQAAESCLRLRLCSSKQHRRQIAPANSSGANQNLTRCLSKTRIQNCLALFQETISWMDNERLDEVPVCQATSLYDRMCTVHSRLQNDFRKRFQNSPAFVRWKKQDAEGEPYCCADFVENCLLREHKFHKFPHLIT